MRLLKLLASQVLRNQDDQNRNHHFFSVRSLLPLSPDHSIIFLAVNKVRSPGDILHPSSHSLNTASLFVLTESSRPVCWHLHPYFLQEYMNSSPPSDALDCTLKHKFAYVTLLLKSLHCLPRHCRMKSKMGGKAQLDRFPCSGQTQNPIFGPSRVPCALWTLIPGSLLAPTPWYSSHCLVILSFP